jgi:hypothetical protein
MCAWTSATFLTAPGRALTADVRASRYFSDERRVVTDTDNEFAGVVFSESWREHARRFLELHGVDDDEAVEVLVALFRGAFHAGRLHERTGEVVSE